MGGRTTVGGVPAVTVSGTSADGTGTLAVATRGRPYPLRMEKSGGEESGRAELKEFGTPVPTETPSPAETVDLDQLDGDGGGEPTDPSAMAL